MTVGIETKSAQRNCIEPDPECDIDPVPNYARKLNIEAALSNSFAFGGSNAVLVIKKWKP